MNNQGLTIFGEVLFDHFPDGNSVLGGAPFNVAWHLQAFGQKPQFISRVGADAEGNSIRSAMTEWGMTTSALQTDIEKPTGRVDVSLENGEPNYNIVHPCAYDAIQPDISIPGCQLLYHGSLALRDKRSLDALKTIKKQLQPQTIFIDVNLRDPWWNREDLQEQLKGAQWVKLNEDELTELGPGKAGDAEAFLTEYGLLGLVVTHGGKGAEILTSAGEQHEITPASNLQVVDTVGAGDAFASIIILGLALNWPLNVALNRAQSFASRIVGNRGATVSDPSFYQPLIEEWGLST